MFSCGIHEAFKYSGGYFWKYVTYYYVTKNYIGYKLQCCPLTLLQWLLMRWWDMRLEHDVDDVAWSWEEEADSRTFSYNETKYYSSYTAHAVWKLIPFYQNIFRIIFKIFFSKCCSLSRPTKQTYFVDFTYLLTHFSHPKPSEEC